MTKKMGRLTLIPTPIGDSCLEQTALNLLQNLKHPTADAMGTAEGGGGEKARFVLAVEDAKVARRRWLAWGLPRSAIETFWVFNEHNAEEGTLQLLQQLKSGLDVYLMSDCGLPAFFDPGQRLVDACHTAGIVVTATPMPNSFALAIALSGFPHQRFTFEGHLPAKDPDLRRGAIERILQNPLMSVLMDTPYRLSKLLSEFLSTSASLASHLPKGEASKLIARSYFLGLDLNYENELLLRGSLEHLIKQVEGEKREFILIVGPHRQNS
jgi:16S rRNA (cytidine1402-2'-O)-methyltransferase